jgi:hypothetical protein
MPDISEINLKTYSKPLETWKYARLSGLLAAEVAILRRYARHGRALPGASQAFASGSWTRATSRPLPMPASRS